MNDVLMIDRIVYISHTQNSYEVYYSFGKHSHNSHSYYALLKALDDNFVRVNENTIINFKFVSKLNDEKIITITNDAFYISSKYKKSVTNTFFRMKLEKFNNTQATK